MRAVVMESYDGPAGAVIRDGVPEPTGSHAWGKGLRMVVDVRAAGLSAIDVLQARRAYQYTPELPYVPGSEVAGVVVETDAGTGFAVGERVGAISMWGALAERALVPPELAVRLPDAVGWREGAAIYMNHSTAWYAYHRSGARAGDTVLVHGAAGGVGVAALDLAGVLGVRAIAVVSSAEKEELARAYGAWAVVRSDGPWREQVLDLTGGHGVEAVLDTVGGDRFTDSLRALRIGGTLVVIGFNGGAIPELRVNRLLLRNLTVTGISMNTMDAERPGTFRLVRDAVQGLLDAGRLRPHLGQVHPFTDAPLALAALETRGVLGKVVVDVP